MATSSRKGWTITRLGQKMFNCLHFNHSLQIQLKIVYIWSRLDIVTAFFYSILDEDIFMNQSERFMIYVALVYRI